MTTLHLLPPVPDTRTVDPSYADAAYNLAITRALWQYVNQRLLGEAGNQATKLVSEHLPVGEAQVPREALMAYAQWLQTTVMVALEEQLRRRPFRQQPAGSSSVSEKRKRGTRGGRSRKA